MRTSGSEYVRTMISKSTEYALRAMICLAQSEERVSVSSMARITRVPSRYLAKVMQGLVHSGLVRSTRGRSGGFVLARRPGEISVLDVVDAVDPIQRICSCPLDLAEHRDRLCALHRRLDDALGHVEAAFRQSTLADLLAEADSPRPLGDPSRPVEPMS